MGKGKPGQGKKGAASGEAMRFRLGAAHVQGWGYLKMTWLGFGVRRGLRSGTVGLAAAAAALTITSDAADARHHHRPHVNYVHASRARSHEARVHEGHVRHHARSEEYSPPSSSIVVDGNTGAVLQAANPDAPRHPASLTKVMTLYLLFERLDSGKMRLDTPLHVSQHAADQDPTKLNLKPGSTITAEDAIKGIVTRSANDAAVTIAENIGGDEDTFAKMMTAKARALGMTRTTYMNASGLPDDDQVTTARDQALLGRAIQDRYPRYYKFFSTESFVFHGESIHGHNHLLGSVDGVDGIKTGFTRASGFNLLTSVHRDGHFLVAVVMGGHSAFARDAHMRDLISEHIKEAAVHRTAPMIAESGESQPIAFAKAPLVAHADPTPTSTVPPATAATVTGQSTNARIAAAVAATAGTNDMRPSVGSSDPIRPLLVRTVSFRTAPLQTASMAPMPALVQVQSQQVQSQQVQQAAAPMPAQVAAQVAAHVAAPAPVAAPVAMAAPQPAPLRQAAQMPVQLPVPQAAPAEQPRAVVASADPAPQIMAPAPVQAAAPQPNPVRADFAAIAAPVVVPAAAQPARAPAVTAEPANFVAPPPQAQQPQIQPSIQPVQTVSAPTAAAIHAHGGWLIQIGAFDDEDQAKQHLSAAQVKVRTALAAADPFTEKVQKGDKALYRARFAGFDKTTAETACKELKRSDFQCMALKD
jgi:D-alanyl-D-alanine carboxypeptidase